MKPRICPSCFSENIIVIPNGNRWGCGDCAKMIEDVPEGIRCPTCGRMNSTVINDNGIHHCTACDWMWVPDA